MDQTLEESTMQRESGTTAAPELQDRLIGHYRGPQPGPTIAFVAGMHGNERSGVEALQKAFAWIRHKEPNLRGTVIGLVGNLQALQHGKRFLESDLNRLWTDDRMAELKATGRLSDSIADSREQEELHAAIQHHRKEEGGPFILIDLHTTSAETRPFMALNDTLLNRKFARKFPLPMILGIEEYLEGPLLSYMNEEGHLSLVFEAGQHDAVQSVDNHHAFFWLSLVFTGLLKKDQVSGYDRYLQRLRKEAGKHRGIYDIRHREVVETGDGFVMKPGFVNFQPIAKGEVLAHRQEDPIVAPLNGSIFMPLYQSQGEDGFFVIRSISYFWLALSAWLRVLRFDELLTLLPGVSRPENNKRYLKVNLRVARFLAVKLFHLLGYRIKRETADALIVRKREGKRPE